MKPTVLAVDDEPEILDLLSRSLENEGIGIHCANTLSEFRKLDTEFSADVYIVDLNLPDGNGLSLVRELREKRHCGIIILSGRTDETDNVLGLELGADDYVTKPFRPREFVARVKAVVRRYRSPLTDPGSETGDSAEADFRFGDYAVSVSSRRVWGPESQEVSLTTAEFDLLCALLEHRGRVMDRDQLMHAMKGRDWEAYDRAIDGLVSRLRKKLPAPEGTSHFIRTVHGIGYTFTG